MGRHAGRPLQIVGEDPCVLPSLNSWIPAFAGMTHSYAESALPILLLLIRPLLALLLLLELLAASPAFASGPIRLFDKSFPEPLGEISQMNSDGKLLAVRQDATSTAQTGVLS